jgi:hypothetical protein
MFLGIALSSVLLTLVIAGRAQSGPAADQAEKQRATTSPATAVLERDFFAAIRDGEVKKFLSYVPDENILVGAQAKPTSRSEIEQQLLHHRDLYCTLFDSSCIEAPIKLDASQRACSDRELLTHSEKVRTAATETTRNGVRQAILVAEVKNDACGGSKLIDFIFNFTHGEWKLFSIPQ